MRSTLTSIAIFIFLSAAQPVWAGWQKNGALVIKTPGTQERVAAISDGADGTIIAWEYTRGADRDIYVQKLNEDGDRVWNGSGVAVCTASGDQWFPQLASDGNGGAIVAWQDGRGASDDIYAQRVASNGTLQWTTNGVAVCAQGDVQHVPVVAENGAGGVMIAWEDSRLANVAVYRQLLDATGVAQLAVDGEFVAGNSEQPQLLWNGQILLVMAGGSVNWNAYNGAGTVTGTGVAGVAVDAQDIAIADDQLAGMIIAWTDQGVSSGRDVFAQRILPGTGTMWGGTVAVCTVNLDQTKPKPTSDGNGGGYVVWEDERTSFEGVYIQCIDSTGAAQWTANGAAVDVVSLGSGADPQIASDGGGGAIVVWSAAHTLFGPELYGQRFDATSAELWTPGGTRIAGGFLASAQHAPGIVATSSGGVIAAWKDTRSDAGDLLAQRLDHVVHSTANAGLGSLRQSLTDANADANYSVIHCDIPGAGPHSIQPTSPLPSIVTRVHIDGYTDPEAQPNTAGPFAPGNATPSIEVNGTSAGVSVHGLQVEADQCLIRGLVINGFGGNGIRMLTGAEDNSSGTIEGCYIGTNAAGTSAVPNGKRGISIEGLPITGSIVVGGSNPAARNLVSGNGSEGIAIVNADLCQVYGNFIGTDIYSTTKLPNGDNGVLIDTGVENRIGGTAVGEGNVISGNNEAGIRIDGPSNGNLIYNNLIGVIPGSLPLGNGQSGIRLTAGVGSNRIGAVGEGNVIGANVLDGVLDLASGTFYVDNSIGTNAIGTLDLGNGGAGIALQSAVVPQIGNDSGGANRIAYNENGIVTIGCIRFTIAQNSIWNNDDLGIDVDSDGVTISGTSCVLGPPTLSGIVDHGSSISVSGNVAGPASTGLKARFYANTVCDASTYGEGGRYLGSATVTTNGGGQATLLASIAATLNPGEVVTATSTDETFFSEKNSEFSQCATPTIATGIDDIPIAAHARLHQNVPNPFNPTTRISYELPLSGGHAKLDVYDVSGRLIRTLVDTNRPAGPHTATWDGRNAMGQPVGSGVYFYRLITPASRLERKMVLLK